MLISICGAQGSGKSRLISELSSEIEINTITRKTSRSTLDEWRVSLAEIRESNELTKAFQTSLLQRKKQDDIAINNQLTITERSFTDLFCYTLSYLGSYNKYSDWINDYYNQCVNENKRYQIVFYLTSGHFDIENDGTRSINNHFCDLMQQTMLHFSKKMYDNNTMFVVIDTPCINQRKTIINQYIERYVK